MSVQLMTGSNLYIGSVPERAGFVPKNFLYVGTPETVRDIISFDGINQYGTLASPWAPGGQGRITLQVRAIDIGTPQFYLLDGLVDGGSRLYTAKFDSATTYSAPAGLTIDVNDTGSADVVYGEVAKITITGDMTGLLLGTFGSRWNGIGLFNGNILYAKFEDLSTTVAGTNDLEFNFSSGVSTEAPINEGASNLITYQNYSADQWATYIQQPNGDWKGKANLVTNGGFETDLSGWSINDSGGTQTVEWVNGQLHIVSDGTLASASQPGILTTGENYLATAVNGDIPDPNIILNNDGGGPDFDLTLPNQQETWEFTAVGTGFDLRRFVGTVDAYVNSVSVNRLIKLSTAQQNQFYIDQTEAAIAGYKAKHTSEYVTTLDGVDDNASGIDVTLAGDFDIELEYDTTDTTTQILLGDDSTTTYSFNLDSTNFIVYASGVATSYAHAGYTPQDGTRHVVKYSLSGTSMTVYLDGISLGAQTITPYTGATSFRIGSSNNNLIYFDGHIRNLELIDHELPLPIGQGGNSGFWPLDDADDVARNVLGLDGNGNVIARTGATLDGFGTWNGSPSRELFSLDVATGPLENNYWPNLLTYSNDLSAGAWGKTGVTVTDVNLVTTTSLNTTAPSRSISAVTEAGKTYTYSVEIMADIPHAMTLQIPNTTFASYLAQQPFTATSTWQRVSVTWTGQAGGIWHRSTDIGEQFRMRNAQLNEGAEALPYVETTDTAGIELELSTELQRLYDLSIVEAKIAKLDAQFARVQPLLDLDGVDDSGTFTPWIPTGDFMAELKMVTGSAISGTDTIFSGDNLNTNTFVLDSSSTSIRALSYVSGALQPILSLSNPSDDKLHTIKLKYLSGTSILQVDDAIVSSTWTQATVSNISLLGDRPVSAGDNFEGRLSALKLIDYTNPSNSRYYMPTATGLVDLLGTGSTDGTYNGSPAAPELFYRVGDNWQNADETVIIPSS